MGGALIQLVVYGTQNIYLTGDPQITFYKSVYKRYTNFAIESIQQDITGSLLPGNYISTTISRNGDLLKGLTLQYNPAEIYNGNSISILDGCVPSNLGNTIFKQIELEIGGQLIDRQYGKWLTIWNDLTSLSYISPTPPVDTFNITQLTGVEPSLSRMYDRISYNHQQYNKIAYFGFFTPMANNFTITSGTIPDNADTSFVISISNPNSYFAFPLPGIFFVFINNSSYTFFCTSYYEPLTTTTGRLTVRPVQKYPSVDLTGGIANFTTNFILNVNANIYNQLFIPYDVSGYGNLKTNDYPNVNTGITFTLHINNINNYSLFPSTIPSSGVEGGTGFLCITQTDPYNGNVNYYFFIFNGVLNSGGVTTITHCESILPQINYVNISTTDHVYPAYKLAFDGNGVTNTITSSNSPFNLFIYSPQYTTLDSIIVFLIMDYQDPHDIHYYYAYYNDLFYINSSNNVNGVGGGQIQFYGVHILEATGNNLYPRTLYKNTTLVTQISPTQHLLNIISSNELLNRNLVGNVNFSPTLNNRVNILPTSGSFSLVLYGSMVIVSRFIMGKTILTITLGEQIYYAYWKNGINFNSNPMGTWYSVFIFDDLFLIDYPSSPIELPGLLNVGFIPVSSSTTNAPTEAYIPLDFWFCRNPGLALPLIALQYHEVKINLQLASYQELHAVQFKDVNLTSIKIYADYIYLDTVERKHFSQNAHEYLIEQLQYDKFDNNFTASISGGQLQIDLNFNNSVKEIIFCGTPNATGFNSQGIGTPEPILNSQVETTGVNVQLTFNQIPRFSNRNLKYFTRNQIWECHSGSGSANADLGFLLSDHIGVYSFALRPEEYQPSGTCNFSRISNPKLVFSNFASGERINPLDIYAVSYNILRIMSGMGSLVYAI